MNFFFINDFLFYFYYSEVVFYRIFFIKSYFNEHLYIFCFSLPKFKFLKFSSEIAEIPEEKDLEEDFKISYEEALKFSKNENLLHFIRKSVLHNNNALFKSGLDELKLRSNELDHNHPAYIGPDYQCEIHDLYIFFNFFINSLFFRSIYLLFFKEDYCFVLWKMDLIA